VEPISVAPAQKKPASKGRVFGIAAVVVLIIGIVGGGFLFSSGALNFLSQGNNTNLPASTPTTQAVVEAPVTPTEANTPTIEPTAVPNLGIGSTIVSEKDGMTLLYVPAGEFTMGSDDGDSNEKPIHKVTLDAFWIDKTEVTNAMYALCVNVDQCNPPTATGSYSQGEYFGNPEFDNYPVIFVLWNDANDYCAWADRRLPTEAEWEKAARGENAYTYPWGNVAPKNNLLNYDNVVGDTTEVGNYPDGVSPYGALDMAGNVWEWVNDWHSDTYYASSPTSNPLGPDSGNERVLRGGSWVDDVYAMRSALRAYIGPADASYIVGFRCSRGTSP